MSLESRYVDPSSLVDVIFPKEFTDFVVSPGSDSNTWYARVQDQAEDAIGIAGWKLRATGFGLDFELNKAEAVDRAAEASQRITELETEIEGGELFALLSTYDKSQLKIAKLAGAIALPAVYHKNGEWVADSGQYKLRPVIEKDGNRKIIPNGWLMPRYMPYRRWKTFQSNSALLKTATSPIGYPWFEPTKV